LDIPGGALLIEVEATEQAVKKAVEDVRYWFGTRNKNIEEGNATLRARIEPVWRRKRERLEAQHGAAQSVLQKLNIPLHQDPNARAKPVEIRSRALRTTVAKPSPKAKEEPSLLREDVLRLVEFIDQYVRQWEVTPRTYARMEEELRDLIVGMLNVNYPGSTTAETFSKLGKTDIRFQADRGNVLIAECKVWHGAARSRTHRKDRWGPATPRTWSKSGGLRGYRLGTEDTSCPGPPSSLAGDGKNDAPSSARRQGGGQEAQLGKRISILRGRGSWLRRVKSFVFEHHLQ